MSFDLMELRHEWNLDFTRHHVNHGSFGAVPRVGLDAQARWQERLQRNPNGFFRGDLMPAIAFARQEIARFLGVAATDIALVRNSTEASNIIFRGLSLAPQDEILVFEHEYGAVTMAAQRAAAISGAKVSVIPSPLEFDDGMLLGSFLSRISEHSRVLVLDQVTSATARVLPVSQFARACKDQGVQLVVDASHGPGNFDFDFGAVQPDYWFGNLHKWACAPIATGALYIAPHLRQNHPPLISSWFDDLEYPLPFDMLGTIDYSSWLATPTVLAFIDGIGWQRWRAANIARAQFGRDCVREALGLESEQSDLLVPMALVPLGCSGDKEHADGLYADLAQKFAVESAITSFGNELFVRISGQIYNNEDDYQALAYGLQQLLH